MGCGRTSPQEEKKKRIVLVCYCPAVLLMIPLQGRLSLIMSTLTTKPLNHLLTFHGPYLECAVNMISAFH